MERKRTALSEKNLRESHVTEEPLSRASLG